MKPERTNAELLAAAHPRPWDWTWIGTEGNGGHYYLTDANGRKIGVLWGKLSEREAAADLIMKLINECE